MAGERRMHVFFSGSVQGVGFRYTALGIAQKLGLTGWVRNLVDGRVELVAEGSEKSLDECLKQIREVMSGYVRHVSFTWEAATGEWRDFSIIATA
jgi:acylphosphatase